MPSQRIDRDEFYKHNFINYGNSAAKEIEWYKNDNINTISLISIDNSDKDYSYMILGLEQNGEYKPIEFSVSIESLDEARNQLYIVEKTLEDLGQKETILYDSEKVVEPLDIPLITNINDELKKYLNKHPEKLYNLTPRKFEELIASIMEDFGFSVELTKQTRDGGKDIIAYIKNGVTEYLTYIECKKHAQTNKVGVEIIREVLGVHQLRKPAKSIIVTTSFFTRDAQEERNLIREQLDLKDYDDVKSWLENYK